MQPDSINVEMNGFRAHEELQDKDSGNESGRNSDYRASTSVDSQLALLRNEMVSFRSNLNVNKPQQLGRHLSVKFELNVLIVCDFGFRLD